MKKKNHTSTSKSSIKSFVFKMLIGALIGGVIGGFLGFFHFTGQQRGFWDHTGNILKLIQPYIFPGLTLITGLSVLFQEVYYSQLKKVCAQLPDAEDDTFDVLDYQEEKIGAIIQGINILSQVLCVILLSFGYSFDYLSGNSLTPLGACIIFVACFFYDGCMQARYVKLLQKVHPEKQGDISSMKFQQQWLDSCDEAEKEIVYQSAYKAYMFSTKLLAFLLLLTMVANLFFSTGILAIVVVGLIYLIQSLVYCRSCVKLKSEKIQR